MSLDLGPRGMDALQSLYRTLTRPNIGTKPCPLCDNQTAELSHFEHFITCHSPLVSSEFIVGLLAGGSEDIFVHAKHFIYFLCPVFVSSLHSIVRWSVCVMLCPDGLYASTFQPV